MAYFGKEPPFGRQNGSGDFLIVGDGILLAYKGSGNVVSVPEGVKRIGAEAFKDHTEINKVVLPNSVEVVGEAAFAGCSALTETEGGAGLRKISDRIADLFHAVRNRDGRKP